MSGDNSMESSTSPSKHYNFSDNDYRDTLWWGLFNELKEVIVQVINEVQVSWI